MENGKVIKRRIQAYLWEFLVGLLEDEECAPFINWTNKFEREFVVQDPDEVASLWGMLKNRPNMNKTKLRRAIRQYYKRDLIMKVKGRVGVYKFLHLPYDPIGLNAGRQKPEYYVEAESCSSPEVEVNDDSGEEDRLNNATS
ncbi:protein C-ets-2-like [Xenia sp. Carnegie-2017]|uniref:protein C-ets-2-like n=1 Tax=Xenia sp. Carnegie-2017 TaxID=2897299 RepID=UPI001F04FC25|nr:protein C-ets-2-like [Xenia sp. Carnegie-2017]XP_046839375.1 protein C-ets-2-like [Xenia sp. Carnegie-2017]XP_046839376.1 protein C-ets-2-like [Xenia sp. Carnegie-2017]XP_046839377.1 protein C-ets-2-like [Xenia sp. Carnegie-2017]